MAVKEKFRVFCIIFFIESWRIDKSEAGSNVPRREYFWPGTHFARFFRNLTQSTKPQSNTTSLYKPKR